MQILQWLFNIAAQEPPRIVTNSTPITQKYDYEDKIKPKDIEISITDRRDRRRHLKRVERSKLNCDNFILFRFLQRKDVSRPFLYQTLNLKGLGSFERNRKSVKTNRSEEIRWADCTTLGGNKVLPIVDSARSSARNDINQFYNSDNKDETKNKKKVVSRMKELLKWAAAAKVLNSKNEAVSKVAVNDVLVSNESPKISFRLEMEDYLTTTTNTSTDDHLHVGIGNWITTDSEFVVLEL